MGKKKKKEKVWKPNLAPHNVLRYLDYMLFVDALKDEGMRETLALALMVLNVSKFPFMNVSEPGTLEKLGVTEEDMVRMSKYPRFDDIMSYDGKEIRTHIDNRAEDCRLYIRVSGKNIGLYYKRDRISFDERESMTSYTMFIPIVESMALAVTMDVMNELQSED